MKRLNPLFLAPFFFGVMLAQGLCGLAPGPVNPLRDPELRSAWIMRARAGEVGGRVPMASLQTHFKRVLEILERQESDSLDLAMDRSEEPVAGFPEGMRDREVRLSFLKEQRRRQIERLVAYAEAGVFPINDYRSSAVPVFVDRRSTACAVGHLMRCSGKEALVRKIVEANRFVCLKDVTEGPVIEWVLQSGLTMEEAMLIQPTYWGSGPTYLIPLEELGGGKSLFGSELFFKLSDFRIDKKSSDSADSSEFEGSLVAGMDRFVPYGGFSPSSPVSGGSSETGWYVTIGTGSVRSRSLQLQTGYYYVNTDPSSYPNINGDDYWMKSGEGSTVWEFEFRIGARRDAFVDRLGIATGQWEQNFLPSGTEAGRIRIESSFFSGEDSKLLGAAIFDTKHGDAGRLQPVKGGDFQSAVIGSEVVPFDPVRWLRVKTKVTLSGLAVFRSLTFHVNALVLASIRSEFTGPKAGRITIDSRQQHLSTKYFLMRSTTLKGNDWIVVDQG
ncbi:MAG: hypothetical protein AAF514_21850, partial [Verrucomicrobiota bacterium]